MWKKCEKRGNNSKVKKKKQGEGKKCAIERMSVKSVQTERKKKRKKERKKEGTWWRKENKNAREKKKMGKKTKVSKKEWNIILREKEKRKKVWMNEWMN